MSKLVFKNYMYNLMYQMLIILLPLITTPYVSRVLGASGLGTYSYTNSITQYFILCGCIGLNLYGQREIAFNQKNISERSKTFFELIILRVISLSISLILFFFLLKFQKKYLFIFSIQIIDIFAAMIDISWFYQGIEEFKKIVIRNTCVKLIAILLIFMLVKTKDDLVLYVFCYSISLFLGNISMWIYLPKYIIKTNISSLNCKQHLRPALLLFIPQIATSVYTVLDKTMIGILTNADSEVAFYEQSQKIIKIALTIATSLGTVLMPRIANLYHMNELIKVKSYMYKSFQFISFLTFPICLGIIGIANGFVPWFFGNGFDKVIWNMIFISPIVIIIGISNVIGTQFLLPTKKQKQYTISVITGTLFNFVLNLILIPIFSSLGAAIATVFSELAVTITQIYFVKNIFDFKKIFMNSIKYILSSIIMFFCICVLNKFLYVSIFSTLFEIIIGMIVYVTVLIVLKDKLIIRVIRAIKR